MSNLYKHIFLKNNLKSQDFTSSGMGGKNIKERDRQSHGEYIKQKLEKIYKEIEDTQDDKKSSSLETHEGKYIVFESAEGFDLMAQSLVGSGIVLKNTKIRIKANNNTVIQATVFIPHGKENILLNKVNDYLTKDTDTGNPKNANLIESIENIYAAVLQSFWREEEILYIPSDNKIIWCEVWLDIKHKNKELELIEFKKLCDKLYIKFNDKYLEFPERIIFLIEVNRKQLEDLIVESPYIAEFRLHRDATLYFYNTDRAEQAIWIKDLSSRLEVNKNTNIIVDILDTGVDNTHLLIKPVLSDDDLYKYDPNWEIHDNKGHGTEMAGIVIYNDLEKALESKNKININHIISSVKILPDRGENKKEHLINITSDAVSYSEIRRHNYKHIICMSITIPYENEEAIRKQNNLGMPSAYSSGIDKICFGEENYKRLFIIPTGNIIEALHGGYPYLNEKKIIEDPAQSWNSITVGAYTQKNSLQEKDKEKYSVIGQYNMLSPFSKTSIGSEQWSIKPDILMEGGNTAICDGFISTSEELSFLTTRSIHRNKNSYFSTINATSCATAKASWLAAQIQYAYPNAWPETIRALMVHSAEWTKEMIKHYKPQTKKDYIKLLRICGYGVPNYNKAINTMNNYLTIISEEYIQPFAKKLNKKGEKRLLLNEIHLYKLQWPNEVLQDLGETIVKMKVTLSYFIEPSPGAVGHKYNFKYQSHGLRFEVKTPTEDDNNFIKRINIAEREENEDGKKDYESSTDNNWKIGIKARTKGSLHSDIWEGTAVDLSTCNSIAVYPVGGWWKDRTHLNKWDSKTRYSLIVSIETPEVYNDIPIDIYTPVINKIEIDIPTNEITV